MEPTDKNNTLKNISKSLDLILDKPADQWTQKEINIYHLLQATLEKYKIRYSLSQFKLDVRDIKKNIKGCEWYRQSKHCKSLNWCLDQLVIKSYQHSRQSGNFKVIARLSQAHVKIEIIKRDHFYYLLENEKTKIKTSDINDLETMTQIFGINPTILPEHRTGVINDICSLIREIGIFYS